MTPNPIATPRGTLRATAHITNRSRVRVRAYIYGDHDAILNPGDALLHVQTDLIDIELLISGAEIEPLSDAFLACVVMRADKDDWLSAPVTTFREAS
jgi:hypothetical protein